MSERKELIDRAYQALEADEAERNRYGENIAPSRDTMTNLVAELVAALEEVPKYATPDRDHLQSIVGKELFNSDNHPVPMAALGRDFSVLRESIVERISSSPWQFTDMRGHVVQIVSAETKKEIESAASEYIESLRAETRLYPDIYASPLATVIVRVLRGES